MAEFIGAILAVVLGVILNILNAWGISLAYSWAMLPVIGIVLKPSFFVAISLAFAVWTNRKDTTKGMGDAISKSITITLYIWLMIFIIYMLTHWWGM